MARSNRNKTPALVRLVSPVRDFLATETASGLLLIVAAAVALLWANSPWSASYDRLWATSLSIGIGGRVLELDLRQWVNDGLMTVFFFVVGLEIKRELTSGHLRSWGSALLPVAAAAGGMVVPALAYLAIAGRVEPNGWGVPVATDIALAAGVVALAGSAVPGSVRVFLLGLAVADDIAAIVLIAVFYSTGVSGVWLLACFGSLAGVVLLRLWGVRWTGLYVVLGCLMWFALYEGGVNPTLAGVCLGLLAPSSAHVDADLIDVEELDVSSVEAARATAATVKGSVSVVEWLEHVLHPWSSFVIVPLFALANVGIEISGTTVRTAASSAVAWGIVVGLVIGKPLGVLAATRVALGSGVTSRPEGAARRHLVGVSSAAGIGFTVALFITDLAFTDVVERDQAKLAILLASIASASLALLILRGRWLGWSRRVPGSA